MNRGRRREYSAASQVIARANPGGKEEEAQVRSIHNDTTVTGACRCVRHRSRVDAQHRETA